MTLAIVSTREVELTWAELVVSARMRLLGLPSRAKQLFPHLTTADLSVLDALVREELDELASEAPRDNDDPAR